MKTSVKSRMDLAVDLGVEFACCGLAQAAAVSSPTPQPMAFSVAILGELLLGHTQPFFLLHLALVAVTSLSPILLSLFNTGITRKTGWEQMENLILHPGTSAAQGYGGVILELEQSELGANFCYLGVALRGLYRSSSFLLFISDLHAQVNQDATLAEQDA